MGEMEEKNIYFFNMIYERDMIGIGGEKLVSKHVKWIRRDHWMMSAISW